MTSLVQPMDLATVIENGGPPALDYLFGLTDQPPDLDIGGIHPSRVRGFVQRWASKRGVDFSQRPAAAVPPVKTPPLKLAPAAAPGSDPAAAELTALRKSVNDLQTEVKTLIAENRRLQSELVEMRSAASKPVEDRDAFIHEFGPDHGVFMFEAGWSLEKSRRVHTRWFKTGGTLLHAAAVIAAEERSAKSPAA